MGHFLIVHFSDFHFNNETFFSKNQINKIFNIVKSKNCNNLIFAFTGDLTFSGSKNEYNNFNDFITNIDENFKEFNVIYEFCPGNHDISYEQGFTRTRDDVIQIFKEKNIKYDNEIKKQKNYFDYVNSIVEEGNKYKEKIINVHHYCIDNTDVKITSFDNVLYGTINDSNDNCQGIMSFNKKDLDLLAYDPKSINILIMHYPHYYFSDKTITYFLSKIKSYQFVLSGHIHRMNENSNKNNIFLEAGLFTSQYGEEDNSNFNIIEINDSETTISKYLWNIDCSNYIEEIINQEIPIGPYEYRKKENYLQQLQFDEFSFTDNFLDYFVLPQFEKKISSFDGDTIDSEKEFFEMINKNKIIIIEGDEESGKTSILKFLILKFSKISIYITGEEIKKNEDNFILFLYNKINEQYGLTKIMFASIDKNEKYLYIDDYIDVSEDVVNIISNLFDKIIITSTEYKYATISNKFKLIGEVNDKYGVSIYKIESFFKRNREELFGKIYDFLKEIRKVPYYSSKKKFVDELEKRLELNIAIFPLTPKSLIIAAKHCYENYEGQESNMYNKAFTGAIEIKLSNTIDRLQYRNKNAISLVIKKLCFFCNENELNIFGDSDIDSIVDDYKNEYDEKIQSKQIIETLKKGKFIDQNNDGKYYFVSKNEFAYFASEEYLALLHNWDENKHFFQNLLDNIFKGVNDRILLFISSTLANNNILEFLIQKIKDYSLEKKELDLINFELFSESKKEIYNLKLLSDSDKQKRKILIEEQEKAIVSKQSEYKHEIFGIKYSEYDKKILTNINYIKLIGVIFQNFHQSIKKEKKSQMIEMLYSYPNRILYNMFEQLNEYRALFISELKNSLSRNGKEINEEDLLYFVINYVRAYILMIYDFTSRNAQNAITAKSLIDYDYSNKENIRTRNIQKLMFLSFCDDDEKFKSYAMELYDDNEDYAIIKNCIKLIVRRYCYNVDNEILFHDKDQKFLKKFFVDEEIKKIMVNRNKNMVKIG